MPTNNKVLGRRQSIGITREYRDLIADICVITRRAMADEVRLLIDRRAVELGLSPVEPVEQIDDYAIGRRSG